MIGFESRIQFPALGVGESHGLGEVSDAIPNGFDEQNAFRDAQGQEIAKWEF